MDARADQIWALLAGNIEQRLQRPTLQNGRSHIARKLGIHFKRRNSAAHAQQKRQLRLAHVEITLSTFYFLIGGQLFRLDLQDLDFGNRSVLVASPNEIGQSCQRLLRFPLGRQRLPCRNRLQVGLAKHSFERAPRIGLALAGRFEREIRRAHAQAAFAREGVKDGRSVRHAYVPGQCRTVRA